MLQIPSSNPARRANMPCSRARNSSSSGRSSASIAAADRQQSVSSRPRRISSSRARLSLWCFLKSVSNSDHDAVLELVSFHFVYGASGPAEVGQRPVDPHRSRLAAHSRVTPECVIRDSG